MDAETANWFKSSLQKGAKEIAANHEPKPDTKKLQAIFETLEPDQQMEMIWNHRAGLWRRMLVSFIAKLKGRG